ncbi:hypothetical protein PLESTB_000432900 [Pleodorina starrii]|uniref:Uncharacterized protein n=1 Tax=Pleodorina starrii TaxID=330485 RepID=A0A9W6BFY8_9CHLO|nr:hypothetical protein PLESTM_001055700 [Pleodorina starrii]GLC50796.1 hypothetical protein PLESTB_000432900 [Pleodorina starrii]
MQQDIPPGYPQQAMLGPVAAAAAESEAGPAADSGRQRNVEHQQQQPPQQQPQQPYPSGGYPPYPLYPPAADQQGQPPPAGGYSYPGGPGAYPPVKPAGEYGASTAEPTPAATAAASAAQPPPQQQQQQQQPVWGTPVLGPSAAPIYSHPMWGPDEETRDSRFALVAWLAFVLGFFFPIFWLIAVLLPCCLPGRHVRWAAAASFLASLAYIIVGIVMGIVGHAMMRGRGIMHD